MLKKNNKLKSIFCMALGIFLVGCQDSSMSDLRAFVDEAFKDEKPEIPPLPVVEPFIPYTYAAFDLNDPFNFGNIIGLAGAGGGGVESAGTSKPPVANRRKEELENYPLDALSMVGTLSKENKPWVVVKTTQGNVLLATIGNYVGENYGKIKRISTEEQVVILTETVPDPSGRWVTRDVEITVDEQ